MTPLKYLQQELGFKLPEWKTLSDNEREQLKQFATEEMKARGIEVK